MSDILLPIFLLIGAGYAAARFGLLDGPAVKALSDVAFMVFAPGLLFRSMALTDFQDLRLVAPAAYFSAAVPLFLAVVAVLHRAGRPTRAAVVYGLACVFSNTLMLGVPMVRLAYGDQGLAILLTIIALHALTLLTLATVILELGEAREAGGAAGRGRLLRAVWAAAKAALMHPVILPIVAGLAWSVTGIGLAAPVDATLALIGGAAPTLCLVLLGASLAQFQLRSELGGALRITVVKSLVHPALAWLVGRWVFGLDPLTLAVVTLAASLPIGANVYLFSQRYDVGHAQVSAGVTLSTLATGLTAAPLLVFLGR